jgi:hypothetical protein
MMNLFAGVIISAYNRENEKQGTQLFNTKV